MSVCLTACDALLFNLGSFFFPDLINSSSRRSCYLVGHPLGPPLTLNSLLFDNNCAYVDDGGSGGGGGCFLLPFIGRPTVWMCGCVCVPYDDVLGTTWLVVKKNSAKNIYTE